MDQVFECDQMPVGVFKGGVIPNTPGDYAYGPFRGAGHLRMGKHLSAGSFARCRYRIGSSITTFDVIAVPAYGVVRLANFAMLSAEEAALYDVELSASDLWTGSHHKRLPVFRLDNDANSHLHGRLRISIAGCLLPNLGFFSEDDVCFNTWLPELYSVLALLQGESDGKHVFDEGEQGQPAYVFERVGTRTLISVIDSPLSDAAGDPTWSNVPCDSRTLARQINDLTSSVSAQLTTGGAQNWATRHLLHPPRSGHRT